MSTPLFPATQHIARAFACPRPLHIDGVEDSQAFDSREALYREFIRIDDRRGTYASLCALLDARALCCYDEHQEEPAADIDIEINRLKLSRNHAACASAALRDLEKAPDNLEELLPVAVHFRWRTSPLLRGTAESLTGPMETLVSSSVRLETCLALVTYAIRLIRVTYRLDPMLHPSDIVVGGGGFEIAQRYERVRAQDNIIPLRVALWRHQARLATEAVVVLNVVEEQVLSGWSSRARDLDDCFGKTRPAPRTHYQPETDPCVISGLKALADALANYALWLTTRTSQHALIGDDCMLPRAADGFALALSCFAKCGLFDTPLHGLALAMRYHALSHLWLHHAECCLNDTTARMQPGAETLSRQDQERLLLRSVRMSHLARAEQFAMTVDDRCASFADPRRISQRNATYFDQERHFVKTAAMSCAQRAGSALYGVCVADTDEPPEMPDAPSSLVVYSLLFAKLVASVRARSDDNDGTQSPLANQGCMLRRANIWHALSGLYYHDSINQWGCSAESLRGLLDGIDENITTDYDNVTLQ